MAVSPVLSFNARALDVVRLELVIVSRAAGLAPPVDGITLAVKDMGALDEDVRRARRLGFGGKLCIHPSQVNSVNVGFSPSRADAEWAHRIVFAINATDAHGAIVVDGKLVDGPVVARAHSILAQFVDENDPGEASAP